MALRFVVGLLVGVAMATGLVTLRLPLAPSVAVAFVVGTLARDALEARQKGRPLRWPAALAQAVVIGGAVWVLLVLLRG